MPVIIGSNSNKDYNFEIRLDISYKYLIIYSLQIKILNNIRMVKIKDEIFQQISKMVNTHKKTSKKNITIFSKLLYKLIKFSGIFSDNCNKKKVVNKDIDGALLTLGITNTQKNKSYYNKLKKYANMSGGSGSMNYSGYCDNHITQCMETQQVCMEGGSNKKTYKKNRHSGNNNRYSSKLKECNMLTKSCLFPKKIFTEVVDGLNPNSQKSFQPSLFYLNYVSKYILKVLLNELD